jgi:AbrB family looped-hinge helix DNA binding protein
MGNAILSSKEPSMRHSTVTSKGQTTIPGEVRAALGIRAGDRLEYRIKADHATIRVHPGTRALSGVLASRKGKGMSFAQVRAAAARATARRGGGR